MQPEVECPFCMQRHTEIVKSTPPVVEGVQVLCNECGARGPVYETKKEAIEGWDEGIMGFADGMVKRVRITSPIESS